MPSTSGYLLHRDDLFINGNELAQVSAMSWEATVEKHIKEELYDSSLKVCSHALSVCVLTIRTESKIGNFHTTFFSLSPYEKLGQ